MSKLIRIIKSRFTMINDDGVLFIDCVSGGLVLGYTDCYGDKWMAESKFGFRTRRGL